MRYTLYVDRRRGGKEVRLYLGGWLKPTAGILILKHGTFTVERYIELKAMPVIPIWFEFSNSVYHVVDRRNHRFDHVVNIAHDDVNWR